MDVDAVNADTSTLVSDVSPSRKNVEVLIRLFDAHVIIHNASQSGQPVKSGSSFGWSSIRWVSRKAYGFCSQASSIQMEGSDSNIEEHRDPEKHCGTSVLTNT